DAVEVSNNIFLGVPSFSPDNTKLYGSRITSGVAPASSDYYALLQYNVSTYNPDTIVNSALVIDNQSIYNSGVNGRLPIFYMRLYKGKIYAQVRTASNPEIDYSLSVIQNPDQTGVACNF